MNPQRLAGLSIVLVAAVMTGCSTFDSDFAAVSALPPPMGIEGAWEGNWQSDHADHQGKLRALVSRPDDLTVRVRFKAWYWGFMTHEQTVEFQGGWAGKTYQFDGAEDLGLLEGIFEYLGYVTPDEFFSVYKSKHDKGIYLMERVGEGEDESAAAVAAQ